MKKLGDNGQIKLLAFDLDGTLLDSLPDLAASLELTLAELNLPLHHQEKVRGWIGNGARLLVKRALAGEMNGDVPAELFDRAYPVFLKHYADNLNVASVLYDGVEETLNVLRTKGIAMACITNKPEQFTTPLLKQLGLEGLFDKVVCGDTFEERKPHPMPLLETAQFFNVLPEQSMMVGDSVNDIAAAQAAGFYSICVDYGYHGGDNVHQLGADRVISQFPDIVQLIQQAA